MAIPVSTAQARSLLVDGSDLHEASEAEWVSASGSVWNFVFGLTVL